MQRCVSYINSGWHSLKLLAHRSSCQQARSNLSVTIGSSHVQSCSNSWLRHPLDLLVRDMRSVQTLPVLPKESAESTLTLCCNAD